MISSRILLFVAEILFWSPLAITVLRSYVLFYARHCFSGFSKDSSTSVVQGVFLIAVAMKNGHEKSHTRNSCWHASKSRALKTGEIPNSRSIVPCLSYVKITYMFTTPCYSLAWNGMHVFRGENLNVNLIPCLKVSTIPHCHWVHIAYIVCILDLHGGTALIIQVAGQTNIDTATFRQKVMRGKPNLDFPEIRGFPLLNHHLGWGRLRSL